MVFVTCGLQSLERGLDLREHSDRHPASEGLAALRGEQLIRVGQAGPRSSSRASS